MRSGVECYSRCCVWCKDIRVAAMIFIAGFDAR